MAKISSQSYPTTNKIPMSGGTFQITDSPVITTAYNDRFAASYSTSVWSKTSQNAVESYSPFRVTLSATPSQSASYVLRHSKQVLTTGSFVLGYKFSISSSNLCEESAFLRIFEGASRSITVSLVYESGAYQIKIVRQISLTATQTYYFPHGSNSLDIVVKCSNRKFSFYKRTDKGLENIGHGYEVPFQNPATLEIGSVLNEFFGLSDPSEALVFAPVQFLIYPCVAGLPCFETLSVTFSESYSEGFAQFSVYPSAPGTFNTTIHGVGQYIGSADGTVDIHVLDVMDRDTETSLVISPVKALYTDAEALLELPQYAAEGEQHNGSLACHVAYLCDGTEEDDTSVNLIFEKGGKTNSNNPNDLPGFLYESDGKRYGMNFAYDSLPYDSNFYFEDYRIHMMRSLFLKSGKKLYYGALVDETATPVAPDYPLFDIRIKLQKVVHETVSEYWAQLFYQNNSDLEEVGEIFSSTEDPLEVGEEIVLSGYVYGSYRIYSAGVRILSVELKRASQSDSEYKVIAQTHWAVQSSTMTFFETEYDNVRYVWDAAYSNCLHFEVKDPVGKLFYVLHDPCTGAYTKDVASSANVDLRTDSIGAAETYDGTVAIFYQAYATRDYTAPGTSTPVKILAPADISFRTLNQTDNGFLETFAGKLISDDFYGLHCFDIARDAVDNLVIVFNRERFLSRGRHHNQSYTIEDGVIDPSFYDTNPSVRGVKESPFLHSGFLCLTLPINELNFSSSLGAGYKNIVRQSSTLIPLVTLRELLKRSSYDLGVQLNVPRAVATRAEAGFLKLNHDPDRNIFVLSLLESRRRIPLVMVGKDTNWKEIAIPAIKGLDAGNRSNLFNPEINLPDSQFRGSSSSGRDLCFPCYSISADFAIDGTIHCFVNQYSKKISNPSATTEDLAKSRLTDGCLLVIPTDIMSVQRKLLIEKDASGNYETSKIFNPLFRQFRFNFLHTYANNIRWSSHVKRDMNYMFNTIGGAVWYAMTRVSGIQSEKQSVETDLEMLSPFSQSTMFDVTSFPFNNLPFYTMPNAANAFDPDPYEITRLLEEQDGVGYELIRSGAMFRARVSYQTDNYNVARPDYFLKMKVISVQKRESGETKYVDACIRISTHQIAITTNDDTTPATIYNLNLDMTKLYDFYIYIKGTQATFRIDELVSVPNFYVNTVSGNLNYLRKNVGLYRYNLPVATTTDEKKTAFILRTGGGQILNSYYKLYEAGWSFSYFDSDSLIYGGPQNGRSVSVRSTGLRNLPFKPEDSHSDILYPVKMSGSDMRSSRYHWPNGFYFDISGVTAKTNDSFTIQRQPINDINVAKSETLHGTWRSVDDVQDVYIWADAQDSGLDKFALECFIVRGCNVPFVTLVGRNDEEDDWQEIETLDLSVYGFPVVSYSDVDGGKVALGDFDFPDGKFYSSDYYFKSNGQRAALVKRAAGGSVALKTEEEVTYTEDGVIFSAKGYKILSGAVSYRYVGLRIEEFDTYQGYFTLENFDFGLLRSIPIEFTHDKGTGMKLDLSAETFTVLDEQDFYLSKRPSKSYEFSYALSDSKTLMVVVSAIDKIGMNRSPVWVIDGLNASIEKFSLCLVESVSSIEPLVEEDGDSYYKFSINLKSLDGE
jgi:hypothetical protein